MQLKKGLTVSTSEFWYDLMEGYINPSEICANTEDADKVNAAIAVLLDFEDSCEEQIPGFYN